ncbi:clathrin light chain, putative [Trypanosoma equiperdum]|uniref:Clathrin light chain n=4 Tax=Trypanozoon TaxID=39700 RepID=Q388C8_TRYB2|nr:hypothetical protein, conserved [Trypanosoma brucei gambiense DAL972]XP_827954.1 hypothetical protein, conserved [Trypanosoma brucei brucei TREU927]RHW69149.1 clathrin light chain [Trypanosoma brucei equiperdum]SCU65182.1 clathrin light chain, putative [Trypanosoma equiperdum]EAN78842.1 hypothetical protein, conserved [Trypanosoma brucei brucei TREU927]CBH16689.1 hypothetical protein, conserved [Trypanosoma brucei gambiense DAL972]|eukprot:XP_011778953.1 hypothetical protein, conserved [Trypanosoma brucei gambiense DAL972]
MDFLNESQTGQDINQNSFNGNAGPALPNSEEGDNTISSEAPSGVPAMPQASEAAVIPQTPQTPQIPPQTAAPVQQSSATIAVCQAAKKGIDARTAEIDAKSREKERQLTEAAQAYLKEQNKMREEKIKEVKAKHVKEQEVQEKQKPCSDENAVWVNVGKMVAFNKVNKYSKNTERMRSILGKLSQSGSG